MPYVKCQYCQKIYQWKREDGFLMSFTNALAQMGRIPDMICDQCYEKKHGTTRESAIQTSRKIQASRKRAI